MRRPRNDLSLLIATLVLLSAPFQLYAGPDETSPPASHSSESSEKKLEQARKSYELYPLNEVLKRNLAEGYAAYGHSLIKQRQYEQADGQFVKAIELYPDEPLYALLRGICQFNLKKYDVARYELERVRALQPESVEALVYLGLVLYETENRLEAVQLWEQGLKLAPARTTRSAQNWDISPKLGYRWLFTSAMTTRPSPTPLTGRGGCTTAPSDCPSVL